MTYCLAIKLDKALVFLSDSRTNAGPDQVSTYSKMQRWGIPGQRQFYLLSAGNLATTQAVVTQINRDIELGAAPNLLTLDYMDEAANYVGVINNNEQNRHAGGTGFEASFILGGQIAGHSPEIYMIYPQGNHITCSDNSPYLQIGETKYGKPILDRIIAKDVALMDAVRCAFVSMDSTMRSNVTVGPPLELAIYLNNSLEPGCHSVLESEHESLILLNQQWNQGLLRAFAELQDINFSEDINCMIQQVDGEPVMLSEVSQSQ